MNSNESVHMYLACLGTGNPSLYHHIKGIVFQLGKRIVFCLVGNYFLEKGTVQVLDYFSDFGIVHFGHLFSFKISIKSKKAIEGIT